MTEIERIRRRLARLVVDADLVGIALVADSDSCSVRVMNVADLDGDDLREAGELVSLHGGCGGAMPRREAS